MFDYFIGVLIGIFSTVMVITTTDTYLNMKNSKELCERSLPRDQNCVIIAVPVSKD